MKTILFALMIIAVASCGNNHTNSLEKKSATETTNENEEDFSNVSIFKSTDCATCHRRTETFAGPSFAAIATRYANAADTTIAQLATAIINGSSGKWPGTTAAMTPHPTLPKEEARAMVKYILMVKN